MKMETGMAIFSTLIIATLSFAINYVQSIGTCTIDGFALIGLASISMGITIYLTKHKFEILIHENKKAYCALIIGLFLLGYLTTLNKSAYSLKIYLELNDWWIAWTNIILLAPISVLSSLVLLDAGNILKNMKRKKTSMVGIITSIISLIVSGCAACGLVFLPIIGISISTAFLPLQGLEIKILALIMLVYTVWNMDPDNCEYCKPDGNIELKFEVKEWSKK